VKILLVDDDLDLLNVTTFALQQAGMLVVTANSFGSALAVFRSEHPDLAILDITSCISEDLTLRYKVELNTPQP